MGQQWMRSGWSLFGLFIFLTLFLNQPGWATSGGRITGDPVPLCEKNPDYPSGLGQGTPLSCLNFDKKIALPLINGLVLKWLHAGSSKCRMRALVRAVILTRYDDLTGHSNYGLDLDGDGRVDISLVYQNAFGTLPSISTGTSVVVCGDFIRDQSVVHQNGNTIINPGLIHWTHSNDGDMDHGTCVHPDGYLWINGVNYGVSPAGKGHCH